MIPGGSVALPLRVYTQNPIVGETAVLRQLSDVLGQRGTKRNSASLWLFAIHTIIQGAITRKQLAGTYRALFDIATRYPKFALERPAIMASLSLRAPVVLFVAVTSPRNSLPIKRV